MSRKVEFNDAMRRTLENRQREYEERLAWLRGLQTGDAVTLTEDGADGLTVTRSVVTRHPTNGSLYVEGHPRRDLRTGKWERGGKNWLQLRIDPVTP